MKASSVLLVGAGGIGAPAAIALGAAGLARLVVVDDDRIELTNLHRQLLFRDEDVGRSKLDAFKVALNQRHPAMEVETFEGRATPETVEALLARCDVVLDATDNFATRFLLADACFLARVPVVHAAAIRWNATVLAVSAEGAPCYRCLFEDLPDGDAPDCATAGVLGPVCGVSGAIAADRALRLLAGDRSVLGRIATFDGRRDRLREASVRRRVDCALCGAEPSIRAIEPSRYEARACDAPLPSFHETAPV